MKHLFIRILDLSQIGILNFFHSSNVLKKTVDSAINIENFLFILYIHRVTILKSSGG